METYRLPKSSALKLIDEISYFLPDSLRIDAVQKHIKILTTLNFLASGSYQRCVGRDFLASISQTSLSRYISQISRKDTISRNHWISRWYSHSIVCFKERNRVCLCKSKTFSFKKCSDWDLGYAVHPFLLTPYTTPTTYLEKNYNKVFKIVRSGIERCIGLLKVRMRCLSSEKGLRYAPHLSGHIINSCVVIHNIMVNNRVPISRSEKADMRSEILKERQFPRDSVPIDSGSLFHAGCQARNKVARRLPQEFSK